MFRLMLWLVLVAACTTATASFAGSRPPGTFNGCPRGTLPLTEPATGYAPTVDTVVLRFIHTSYLRETRSHEPKAKLARAKITGVILVRHWLPSGWIKSECGQVVWLRSLAVTIYFPAMNPPHNPVGSCNACAHVVLLTSRTRRGWTVWGIY